MAEKSPKENPEELADQLQQQGDTLEDHSAEVEQQIAETRQDWQHKRADDSVPGAPPPEHDEEEPAGDRED